MIDINQYYKFWQRLAGSLSSSPTVSRVECVASPQDIARLLATLKGDDYPVLFVAIPEIATQGTGIDDIIDSHQCVLFLLDRYDVQRRTDRLVEVLSRLQFPLEGLRQRLLEEASVPCSPMVSLDAGSISIMAVTDQYANTAGWSMAFSFQAGFDAIL